MRRSEPPPAARRMRVFAVVVTHDRLAQLRLTVTRLLAEDLDRVIVVDNASADGTGDWLASLLDPRLEVLTLPQNRGGAGGFAAGLARAQAHDPDWTVVMDDDARPMPGTIEAFRALEPAGWDALAAAVHLPCGAVAEMNRPARNPFAQPRLFFATLFGGSARYHVQDCDYPTDRTLPVDMVSFVGLFLSRRALRRAGLPDAALFIYGDDVLYALRLRAEGLAVGFEPRLRFIHDCKTLQGDAGIYRPLWKSFYHHRNLVFVLRAAAGRWLFPPLLGCLALRWLTRARHYRPQERRIYLALLRLALADGLRGRTDRPHAEIRRRAGEPVPQAVPHADAGLTRPLPPIDRPEDKGRDAA